MPLRTVGTPPLPPLKQYAISSVVLHGHDAEGSSTSTTYVKVKTITISVLAPTPIVIRTYFEMRRGAGVDYVYGRIYKNGVAVGTEQSTNSTAFPSSTEDLSFAEGDTLELWVNRGAATDAVHYRNFRVLGEERRAVHEDPFQGVNS